MGLTLSEHSRARARGRQGSAPTYAEPGTFGAIARRGEVAFLHDQGCVPSDSVEMIQLDEPPWGQFLRLPVGRFLCPACRRPLEMHCHHGPGTPGTERFPEPR